MIPVCYRQGRNFYDRRVLLFNIVVTESAQCNRSTPATTYLSNQRLYQKRPFDIDFYCEVLMHNHESNPTAALSFSFNAFLQFYYHLITV